MDGTSRFRPLAGLSDRLKLSARDQNIEPQTLRGRYFRQRFFARLSQLYPDQWVLTGATALELRANSPRSTSDLDTITTLALNDLGDAISALGDDPEDPFTYQVKIPKRMQATTGVQAKVTVMLGGKPVESFRMDIEHSRASGTPPEEMDLHPVVTTNTAADSSARILVQSAADHIAAKVAGMSKLTTTTDKSGQPSVVNAHRYHDLADLAILSEVASVSLSDLQHSLAFQADKHGVEAIPETLALPGEDWTPASWEQARQARSWPAELTLDLSLNMASRMVNPALTYYHQDTTPPALSWSPAQRSWTLSNPDSPARLPTGLFPHSMASQLAHRQNHLSTPAPGQDPDPTNTRQFTTPDADGPDL
ncbi:nucleotidyl transferase AbiEii/AbiGii toxin family protein [Corynebacterium variabile]|uniref:nucleotidyl transferase AbiEii/AbiGii toxin family protein n=1 Tax=Corynebacterium variabile TaxID=1727 RepID=UPI0028A027CC|nr:nucleotidyl transferase AbiEii/AbiGii toxin family protein [Corynebacterium variabile]